MTDRHDTQHRARYRRILRFAARQFVQLWWFEIMLPRLGMDAVAERTRDERMQRLARRFRALAIELGGLMIKVGQFLSSRLDVLPPEITAELASLQDEVPAVPFADIRTQAEAELGMPLEQAYASFERVPVAAASLGQAHRATLTARDAADTGFADVVVKVQRPGIEGIIDVDLAALRKVAGWLKRVRFVADKADAPALVEEFAVTTLEEVDYLHEAASAARFAENFADDPCVAAPEVAWELTTRRVLTLADVTAIKINDIDGLRAAGIDPVEVAQAFAGVMFDQVFLHSFFHADPHPGNIFVTPVTPVALVARASGASTSSDSRVPEPVEGPRGGRPFQLTFIDFGMMGAVPDSIRHGLRELVIAIAARDSRRLVAGVKEVGALLPSANTTEFEYAVTALFARFGGMGFAELKDVDPREFRDFGNEFGEVIRQLPFQLPEGFLLLMRAVSLTSGMCSALDPAFNVWDAVEPYAGRLLRDESGNAAKALAKEAMATASTTWRLPRRIDDIITRMDGGTITFDTSRLERRMTRIEHLGLRVLSAVLFGGLIVGGALLLPNAEVLAVVLLAASPVPLAHALFAGVISRMFGRNGH